MLRAGKRTDSVNENRPTLRDAAPAEDSGPRTQDWLAGARLAPSAHNTQPWRFRPLSEGRIRVGWDRDRELPAADPTSRDLWLSIGATVEGARLAAAGAGAALAFQPDAAAPDTIGWLVPGAGPIDAVDRRLAEQLAGPQ